MTVVPAASSETNMPSSGTNVGGETNSSIPTSTAADASSCVPMSVSPIVRRNRPGTKEKAFCAWPEEDWTEMDSTLAVQQVLDSYILIVRDEISFSFLLLLNVFPLNLTSFYWLLVHTTNYTKRCF